MLQDIEKVEKVDLKTGLKVSRPNAWESRSTITKMGTRGRRVSLGRKHMRSVRQSLNPRYLNWDVQEAIGNMGLEVGTSRDRGLENVCKSYRSGWTIDSEKVQEKNLGNHISKAVGEKEIKQNKQTNKLSKKGTSIYWPAPGAWQDTLNMWSHLAFTICSWYKHFQLCPLCR